jgi:methylthioribose-1-phosphate isomerase
MIIRTIFWEDNTVVMIDQNALPQEERYLRCRHYEEVVAAIKDLTIRGAPAIGVAAAMGIALGMLNIFRQLFTAWVMAAMTHRKPWAS